MQKYKAIRTNRDLMTWKDARPEGRKRQVQTEVMQLSPMGAPTLFKGQTLLRKQSLSLFSEFLFEICTKVIS